MDNFLDGEGIKLAKKIFKYSCPLEFAYIKFDKSLKMSYFNLQNNWTRSDLGFQLAKFFAGPGVDKKWQYSLLITLLWIFSNPCFRWTLGEYA